MNRRSNGMPPSPPFLIFSKRAEEAGDRAILALTEIIASSTRFHDKKTLVANDFSDRLKIICEVYYYEKKRLEIPTYRKLKSQLDRIQKSFSELDKDIKSAEPELKERIAGQLRFAFSDDGLLSNSLSLEANLYKELHFDRILKAVQRVSIPDERKRSKGAPAHTEMHSVFAALSLLWTDISGEPMKQNCRFENGKSGLEFDDEGMRFVHKLAQAIDPKITISQVRSASMTN